MSDDRDRTRVLHVDDDAEFGALTAEVLEREHEGIDVVTATSADEGLERLEADAVDCVVSDYDMPGRDGIEFLEAVREEYPDLPFILFTGKGSETIAAEAVRAGATDYLQKSSGTDQYALLANRITNAAEKYAAEHELRKADRRFRKLLEGSADYVHVLDLDGTVEYVSPAIERVLGYEPEDVIGTDALEYVHPEDRAAVADGLDEILDEPGAEATVEIRTRDADGEWCWVEVRARNLLEDPDIGGIVANARDVTDRRESQAAVDWHRRIIENLGEGVYVQDADYRLQFASHRVDDVPVSAEDWVGEPISQMAEAGVLSEEEVKAVEDAVDGILAGEREEARMEVEPAYPEETEAVELHLRPLPAPDGEEVVLGTTRDITDRRQRATQLETLHDVTRRMMVARTHDDVAEIAVDAVRDILGLSEVAVFRYDGERDALVPVADRVQGDTLRDGIPAVERGEGVAWNAYESGETAVVEDTAGTTGAHGPDSPVESELLVPLDGHGVLVAGSTTRQEFDDQTVSLAEVLGANLTAAFTQVDRARELEEYERLVETMGDSVYSIDLDGEYIRFNETFRELTGYSRDRLLEEGPELVLEDDAIERFEAAVRRLLGSDGGVETVEADLYTAERGPVPIEANLTLLPAEDGGYRGTVGVIRDLTERREREQELERYETVVRAVPDEVYTLDAEGYLTSIIPPAGAEMTTTGYNPEELVGQHVSVVMPESDIERAEELIQQLLASDTERTASFEMHTIRKDGKRVPHENHIALLRGEDGEFAGTVGVLRNIANRKDRERELRRQNERLEKFASVVSHDLRNPLNVASARLDLAQEECESSHLDDIEAAHDRMARLIEAVLELAREGEEPDEVQALSLKDLAEQCWTHVDTGEATLVVDTDRMIRAEETRVGQLLENLIRNAVEHAGRPVTVRVGELPGGFYVEDDGPGIPADRREEIFEPGYSSVDGGTGLGLNIVEEIAEAHGWTVTATESSDGGARFEFTGVS